MSSRSARAAVRAELHFLLIAFENATSAVTIHPHGPQPCWTLCPGRSCRTGWSCRTGRTRRARITLGTWWTLGDLRAGRTLVTAGDAGCQCNDGYQSCDSHWLAPWKSARLLALINAVVADRFIAAARLPRLPIFPPVGKTASPLAKASHGLATWASAAPRISPRAKPDFRSAFLLDDFPRLFHDRQDRRDRARIKVRIGGDSASLRRLARQSARLVQGRNVGRRA